MKGDRVSALFFMAFAVLLFVFSLRWPFQAVLYPRLIIITIFTVSVCLYLFTRDTSTKTWKSVRNEIWKNRRVLFIAASSIVFVATINILGFFVGLVPFLIVVQLLMGTRGIAPLLASAVSIWAFIFVMFVVVLSIPLPIAFWLM